MFFESLGILLATLSVTFTFLPLFFNLRITNIYEVLIFIRIPEYTLFNLSIYTCTNCYTLYSTVHEIIHNTNDQHVLFSTTEVVFTVTLQWRPIQKPKRPILRELKIDQYKMYGIF